MAFLLDHGEPGRALAQCLGEALGIVHVRGQHGGEAIAGNARAEGPGGQTLADELAQLPEQAVTDVHAGLLVDHVQLVDVDVERAPVLVAALLEHRPQAPLELHARVQTA